MSEPLDAPEPGQDQGNGYKFQIIFNGLCAFVPSADIDETLEPEKVDVLLVNTEHPRAELLKYDHEEKHHALLKYELKDVDPAANPKGKEACGLWMLENEQLTLEVRKRTPGGEPIPSPKRELKIQNFEKVPRIDKIFPEGRELDPAALEDDPQELVAARLTIDQGTLDPFSNGVFMNEEIIAQFVPPPSKGDPVVQALTTKVRLALELESDEEVVIRSKDFGPGMANGDVRQLVLNPAPPGELVQISISNLCCGRFMDYEADEDGELPAPDTDFEYHFMLSKEYDNLVEKHILLPIPFPVKYKSVFPDNPIELGGFVAGGGETIRCNISLFNPTKPTG